ncbi:hypothetical protein D3C77_464560 [compost metagenome]
MVGQDHLPGAPEFVCVTHFIGQYASDGHEADEAPEQPTDDVPDPLPMARAVTGQAGQQRKHQDAQTQAANTEQAEADGSGQQAPIVVVLCLVHGLRRQCHVRRLPGWVQAVWPVSR